MLSANLLPKEEKKQIHFEENRRIVGRLSFWISAILLAGCALILPAYISVALEQNNLAKMVAVEEEASAKLNVEETAAKTRVLRAEVSSVRAQLERPKAASAFFEKFIEHPVSGISLLSASVSGQTVNLQGIAATRGQLLEFEKSLRESGWFQEISSPLSNIIKETNINFSFQGKLTSLHSW